MVLSKTRDSPDLHVGYLGKVIRQIGKRIDIMPWMLLSEIIIFAIPRQRRVNFYKKYSQFNDS